MDSERRRPAAIVVTEEASLWDLTERLDLAEVFEDAERRPGVPVPRLPPTALTPLYEAACAAAVARRLITGTLTVDVLGTAPTLWWHAAVLCRSLRTITHLAVTADVTAVPPSLADQLVLAGIDVSPTTEPFGADLVVATGPADIGADRLRTGALLIEAAPDAFPAEVHRRAATGAYTLVSAPPPDPARESAFAAELDAAGGR